VRRWRSGRYGVSDVGGGGVGSMGVSDVGGGQWEVWRWEEEEWEWEWEYGDE